jgi:hypothetical protein
MRFPSHALLAEHAAAVLRRFPWTLGADAVAAGAAIAASSSGTDDAWGRLAFVAALGLPVTVAVTLRDGTATRCGTESPSRPNSFGSRPQRTAGGPPSP